MFVQVEYALEDIKGSMLTTDTYIENYLPHKMLAQCNTLLQELFSSADVAPAEQRSTTGARASQDTDGAGGSEVSKYL